MFYVRVTRTRSPTLLLSPDAPGIVTFYVLCKLLFFVSQKGKEYKRQGSWQESDFEINQYKKGNVECDEKECQKFILPFPVFFFSYLLVILPFITQLL